MSDRRTGEGGPRGDGEPVDRETRIAGERPPTFHGSGRAGRATNTRRCRICALHDDLCICAEVSPIATRTRVRVLIHQKEICKSTNTGRLAALALERGELWVRGRKGAVLDTRALIEPGTQPLVLFPGPTARSLDELIKERERAGDERPVTLVVPDGTWRQARKSVGRTPELAGAPRVTLPPGPPSRYRLRHHPDPTRLATFEAIARALGLLEGDAVRDELERLFALMVERTLWTRGMIPAEEVTGGIPDAARIPNPPRRPPRAAEGPESPESPESRVSAEPTGGTDSARVCSQASHPGDIDEERERP